MGNKMKSILVAACVAGSVFFCSSLVPAGEGQTKKGESPAEDQFFQEHIHNHLEIGTRALGYSFKDNTRGEPFNGSYLGSLNEIYEHQNYAPTKVFAQYKFSPYGGVGVAYDSFEAGTGSSPDGEDGGDGDFELRGIYFYLVGTLDNSSRFTPYAELGIGLYGADFVAKEEWSNDGQRAFNPDNPNGVAFAIGCDIELKPQWSLGLYLRHMSVDVDVDYLYEGDVQSKGNFDLAHYSYGLGVKYSF